MKNIKNNKNLILLALSGLMNQIISMENFVVMNHQAPMVEDVRYDTYSLDRTISSNESTSVIPENIIPNYIEMQEENKIQITKLIMNLMTDPDVQPYSFHQSCIIHNEYEIQENSLIERIQTLESSLKDQSAVTQYNIFASVDMKQQIQYIKAGAMLKMIKISDNHKENNLYNGFKQMLCDLCDNDWKFNGKSIFTDFNKHKFLLANLDNKYDNNQYHNNQYHTNRDVQYREKLLYFIKLFSNQENFTEEFQKSVLNIKVSLKDTTQGIATITEVKQNIGIKELFNLFNIVLINSENLAILENYHLQLKCLQFIQKKENFELMLKNSLKKPLNQFNDNLFNQDLSIDIGFPLASSSDKIISVLDVQSSFIQTDDGEYVNLLYIKPNKKMGYYSQYIIGDCHFKAHNITRHDWLNDLLSDPSKASMLSPIFLSYIKDRSNNALYYVVHENTYRIYEQTQRVIKNHKDDTWQLIQDQTESFYQEIDGYIENNYKNHIEITTEDLSTILHFKTKLKQMMIGIYDRIFIQYSNAIDLKETIDQLKSQFAKQFDKDEDTIIKLLNFYIQNKQMVLNERLNSDLITNIKTYLFNNIVTNDEVISEMMIPTVVHSNISLSKSINYLKKYHEFKIDESMEQILSNSYLDVLEIIKWDSNGTIVFTDQFNKILKDYDSSLNVQDMIKIFITAFNANGSYMPNIARDPYNSFFNNQLMNTIDFDTSYLIDGSIIHSDRVFPIIGIPVKFHSEKEFKDLEEKIKTENPESLTKDVFEFNDSKKR